MATPAANVITKASIPTKIYQLLIKSAEPLVPKKLHPLWNHPAGKSTMTTIDTVAISCHSEDYEKCKRLRM